MLEKFSATIEMLYAAAVGEKPWEEALHSIEDLTGSVGAVIGFVPAIDAHTAFNLAGRFTEEQCATYSQLYQPICRRTKYMIDHPDCEVVYDSLLITEQEMKTDPVYDWFSQHDLRYFVGAALPRTRSHFPVLSLQRSPSQGHVQAADLQVFKQVKVHVGRALTLADQLGRLRCFEGLSSAVFEALPQAVYALDGTGRLIFANDAASEQVRTGDGLSVCDGRLVAALSSEQASMERLIAAAANNWTAADSGWVRISRASGKSPYAVFVAPLRIADEQFSAGAKVLVIVHDPCARPVIDPQMLRSLYGLTGAEARLAGAIAGGHSLESAAISLQMQVGTARSHLKSIFAKMGVNRQQDLVGQIASLTSIKI